jgi:hypothetical protein
MFVHQYHIDLEIGDHTQRNDSTFVQCFIAVLDSFRHENQTGIISRSSSRDSLSNTLLYQNGGYYSQLEDFAWEPFAVQCGTQKIIPFSIPQTDGKSCYECSMNGVAYNVTYLKLEYTITMGTIPLNLTGDAFYTYEQGLVSHPGLDRIEIGGEEIDRGNLMQCAGL